MLSDFVYDNGRENALARFSGIRARFRRRAAMESRSCFAAALNAVEAVLDN
jgi:hypothetical protein